MNDFAAYICIVGALTLLYYLSRPSKQDNRAPWIRDRGDGPIRDREDKRLKR